MFTGIIRASPRRREEKKKKKNMKKKKDRLEDLRTWSFREEEEEE